MIELQVKSRSPIPDHEILQMMKGKIPDIRSMEIGKSEIICYSGYGHDQTNMTIVKQLKDKYGNVILVSKANNESWENRKTLNYSTL